MDSSSHIHFLLQEVLRSQQRCLHELSSLNHEISSLNHDLAVTYTTTSPWSSYNSFNQQPTLTALTLNPHSHYHSHTTTSPWTSSTSFYLQPVPPSTHLNTTFVHFAPTYPATLPIPDLSSLNQPSPISISSTATHLNPHTYYQSQPLSPILETTDKSTSKPLHIVQPEHLEPSKPLTLISLPPPQSPPVQPPYLQPLLVPSPRPPESISISPPLLLPPPPLPSKPPDREVSTSPDLANSDSLTPLPPFLPPRLKPQPEPPDAVPSPSSTLFASPEPPEPPDLAKTLSRCDSKLPSLAMPVNDEVFTKKSRRGGSAATDSSSQVTEEHKVFASAIFTVLDSLSLIFVCSDSVCSDFAYDRDPHLASFHVSDSFFFIPQLLPSEIQTHITMSTSFSTPIPVCVLFVVNGLFGDRATHVAIIVTSYNGTFTLRNSSNTVGKDSDVYHILRKGWINFTNCLEVFNHI